MKWPLSFVFSPFTDRSSPERKAYSSLFAIVLAVTTDDRRASAAQ